MLVAALVLALVAFVALVNFVISGADWSLYIVFAAAGLGLVCFILDCLVGSEMCIRDRGSTTP